MENTLTAKSMETVTKEIAAKANILRNLQK